MRVAEWCPGLVPRLPDKSGNLSNSVPGQPCKVGDRCSSRGVGNGWRHCLSFTVFLLCSLSSIVFFLLKCHSNIHPHGQLSAQQKQTGMMAAPASGAFNEQQSSLTSGTSSLQEPQHRQEEYNTEICVWVRAPTSQRPNSLEKFKFTNLRHHWGELGNINTCCDTAWQDA